MSRYIRLIVGVYIYFSFHVIIIESSGTEEIEKVTLVPPEMQDAEGKSHRRKLDEEVYISPPNCRKMMLVMAKKQFKVFMACSKEVQAAFPVKEDFTTHFQCVIKCALGKEKMLDENFLISNETIQNFFDRHIPPHFHEVGHIIVGGCAEEWGPQFSLLDEKCTAHGNFLKCLQDVVSDMC